MKKSWVYIFVFLFVITGIILVSSINLDLNHDGNINVQDLQILAAHYEGRLVYNSSFDLNGDGKINLFDIVGLARKVVPNAKICEAIAPAKCYYVAPNGNNANDGSFQHPFKSPQVAANKAGPGDYIYLRGGTYNLSNAYPYDTASWNTPGSTIYYNMLNIVSIDGLPSWAQQETNVSSYSVSSGTSNAPITVKAYPGEHPVFDGYGVIVSLRSYWVVQGIDITNASVYINGGTSTEQTHDITIRDSDIGPYSYPSLPPGGGQPNIGIIKIDRGDVGGPYNIFIINNTIHDLSDPNNPGWDNPGAPVAHYGAITTLSAQIYYGYDTGGTGYIEIENNTIYDTPSIFFFKNPMEGPVLVKGNVIYNSQALGMIQTSNLWFYNNLVYNITTGFNPVGDVKNSDPRMNNITGQDARFINNTFVGLNGFLTMAGGVGHTIKNNVFFGFINRPDLSWSGCCSDTPAYLYKTDNWPDTYNTSTSMLQSITSNDNCFITPSPVSGMELTKRLIPANESPNGTAFIDHYSITKAQSTFGFDTNSVFIAGSDPSAVFDSNYHLIGTAATECSQMGYDR